MLSPKLVRILDLTSKARELSRKDYEHHVGSKLDETLAVIAGILASQMRDGIERD